MYLKKLDGPRVVTLKDGQVLTIHDLPPASTRRWVASRKSAVANGVCAGLISRDAALERYGLSDEELDSWIAKNQTLGEAGLRVTRR